MSMARAAGSTSIVSLTSKEFPSEFENVFVARNQSSKQNFAAEKVMITGADRRRRIMADYSGFNNGTGFKGEFPGIGLLRMEFNGTPFTGTASMIANGSCLLTCAHNVVEYDATAKEFVYATSVWFELRNNNARSGSALIKRYKVTKIAVYPPYFKDPTSESGFDLALCWIHAPRDDSTVKQLYSGKSWYDMPNPVAGSYLTLLAAVVGFPGEHRGEKWGMVAAVPGDKSKDWSFPIWQKSDGREILEYKFIDTSPGQSGSPVMAMKPRDIIGVHTGGSASLKKNWATYITPAKLRWIVGLLGGSWDLTDFYGTLFLTQK